MKFSIIEFENTMMITIFTKAIKLSGNYDWNKYE